MPKTLYEIIADAKVAFQQNADTLVAGFLIRHPDVDPADVELVMMPVAGEGLRFSIEPKELHVPPVAYHPNPDEYGVGPQQQLALGCEQHYERGWNDCREAMIAKKKAAKPHDALTVALGETLGLTGDDNG